MDYKISKLSELNEIQVRQATAICVEGLYDIFSMISKDKNLLTELFMESFDYDMCYACLHDGEAVGFIGLGNSSKRAAGNMKLETFEKLFDKRKAKYMFPGIYAGMGKPKVKSDKELEVDFLATSPALRSKGIGKLLMVFVCENLGYETCVLDVYSKNIKAIKFYERLGFKQYSVKSEWMIRLFRGIGKTITMKLNINEMKNLRDNHPN